MNMEKLTAKITPVMGFMKNAPMSAAPFSAITLPAKVDDINIIFFVVPIVVSETISVIAFIKGNL